MRSPRPRKVIVFWVDERSPENLTWYAATYGINRLFWADSYLLCVEVYEKSFEHEIVRREFPISHTCYTHFPKYKNLFEVKKGTEFVPVVQSYPPTREHVLSLAKSFMEMASK